MVIPRTFAVLRFTNSSNLAGRSMGRAEGALQVRGILQLHRSRLQCHQLSYPLKLSKLSCIDVGVPKDGDPRRPGTNLLEDLQVLATQLGKIEKQSSDVASRARNACH